MNRRLVRQAGEKWATAQQTMQQLVSKLSDAVCGCTGQNRCGCKNAARCSPGVGDACVYLGGAWPSGRCLFTHSSCRLPRCGFSARPPRRGGFTGVFRFSSACRGRASAPTECPPPSAPLRGWNAWAPWDDWKADDVAVSASGMPVAGAKPHAARTYLPGFGHATWLGLVVVQACILVIHLRHRCQRAVGALA